MSSPRLESVLGAVGRTPLVRLRRVTSGAPDVPVFAKLELANPGGSVKDRAALRTILDARADGRLTPDRTLVDATTGNAGIAYALFGAALGVKVRLFMPADVSKARKDIVRSFGAEVTFTDPLEGLDGAIRRVHALVAKEPDRYFHADQFANRSNVAAHYDGTGPELLEALGDGLTHFVAGVGTGGTLVGTGRRLKERTPPVRCVGVQPAEATHGLQGLRQMVPGQGPALYEPGVADETILISTADGRAMGERLTREEGILAGHSSGAAVAAAVQVAERLQRSGERGCVAVIVCDRGDRYFAPIKWERRYTW